LLCSLLLNVFDYGTLIFVRLLILLSCNERNNLADHGIVIFVASQCVRSWYTYICAFIDPVILKWLHMHRTRLSVMKWILNMFIVAYVHVCLMMCAYRCLCIRIWLYDMLRRRNLGNYSPMFKAINNVISFSTCSRSNPSYLFNRMESNRMVVCRWLHVAYVVDYIMKLRKSLLTLCTS